MGNQIQYHLQFIVLNYHYSFFRHNKPFYWLTHIWVPFGHNVIFRYLFGWLLPYNFGLLKRIREAWLPEEATNHFVLQDFGLPLRHLTKGIIYNRLALVVLCDSYLSIISLPCQISFWLLDIIFYLIFHQYLVAMLARASVC